MKLQGRTRDALAVSGIIVLLACLLVFFGDTHFTVSHAHKPAVSASGNGVVIENDRAYVDINTADLETLCSLPGIGEVIAAAIIADRQENGPYGSLEDLLRVSGIGEKTIEKLRLQAGVDQNSMLTGQ